MRGRRFWVLSTLLVVPCALWTGCSSYYSVTDPATKKVFHTPKVTYNKRQSSVTFVDARTGMVLSVTNAVVTKLTRDQFNKALW